MEYYSAIKKSEIMFFVGKQIELEISLRLENKLLFLMHLSQTTQQQ
jgi:hypothetical protein